MYFYSQLFAGFFCPDSNWRDISIGGLVLGRRKENFKLSVLYFIFKDVFALVSSLLEEAP